MSRADDLRERNKVRAMVVCRHFTGIQHDTCRRDVVYTVVMQPATDGNGHRLPCLAEGGHCAQYQTYTEEEVQAQEKEQQRSIELFMRGLSDCCEAPIDTSLVITEGQYRNHGPRFCSKCKKVVAWV